MIKYNRVNKVITFASFIIFIYGYAFSQELNGKYEMGEDYFYFHEQIAEFSFQCEGGFTIPIKGVGKFDLFSGYLIIHTSKFNSVNKKYYTKSEFKGEALEQIIEEEIIAFKISTSTNDQITLLLLPVGSIQKFYTADSLLKLEKEAKQKEFRIRVFKKV